MRERRMNLSRAGAPRRHGDTERFTGKVTFRVFKPEGEAHKTSPSRAVRCRYPRGLLRAAVSPWWTACGLLAAGAVALLVLLVAAPSSADAAPLRVGTQPPEISLPLLAGGTVRIPAAVQGKVAVIHFWSTGCSTTCRDEMMALEALSAAYRGRGLAVVTINVGQKVGEVRDFLKGVNPTYPVALDTNRKGALTYDSVDLPRTFILDRKGLIRYKVIGGASEGTLKKMVLSLL